MVDEFEPKHQSNSLASDKDTDHKREEGKGSA